MSNNRFRTNISFNTQEELDELRLRTTYLGYSSMGAYISAQLQLDESLFNVDPDLQQSKIKKEKEDDEYGNNE